MPLLPEDLELLRKFEAKMIANHPLIARKAPIYFARSHDDDVYAHPEARCAFLGFVAGMQYATEIFKTAKGTL